MDSEMKLTGSKYSSLKHIFVYDNNLSGSVKTYYFMK
jgi:hypothetical protein